MFPHDRFSFSQSAKKGYVKYVPSPVRLKFNEEKKFGVESTSWPTSLTYSAIYSELTLINFVSVQIRIASWSNG